jgi:hypothetical protein
VGVTRVAVRGQRARSRGARPAVPQLVCFEVHARVVQLDGLPRENYFTPRGGRALVRPWPSWLNKSLCEAMAVVAEQVSLLPTVRPARPSGARPGGATGARLTSAAPPSTASSEPSASIYRGAPLRRRPPEPRRVRRGTRRRSR